MVSNDDFKTDGLLGSMWKREGRVVGPKSVATGPLEEALFDAIEANDLAAFLDVLDKQPILLARRDGHTLLNKAVMKDNLEMILLLLEREVPVSGFDLCQAMARECHACLEELIKKPALFESLNQSCLEGMTPLIFAVRWGDPKLVSSLIEAGASLDITDQNGRGLLDYASELENRGDFWDAATRYSEIEGLLEAQGVVR